MEIEKISYLEAIRKIASDLGIALPVTDSDKQEREKTAYDEMYQANQFAMEFFVAQMIKASTSLPRDYLKNRDLNLSTIKKSAYISTN